MRSKGEGTIRQRPDGTWEARFALENGKRCSIYGKTQAEARDRLRDALKSQADGTLPKGERQTVIQFLNRWLEDSAKPTVRVRTYVSYEQLIRVHVAPSPIAKVQLHKLNPQQLQALLNAKLAEGLHPRTVHHLRAVLRRALGQALKWGLVARNVATLVDPPRVPRQQVEPLSPEQARRFLEVAKEDRLYAMYAVALGLGLRQGEIFGLRWQDIDFDKASLRVTFAMQRIGGCPQFVEPKTQRSRRALTMPAFVMDALREHKVRQLEERLVAGSRWQDWGLVFTTTTGTPLEQGNLSRTFKPLLSQAELPNIRFHDLRHSCASLLLAKGMSPRTIMEQLGHSQISLTMNTYAHVMPSLLKEAADAMDQLLGER